MLYLIGPSKHAAFRHTTYACGHVLKMTGLVLTSLPTNGKGRGWWQVVLSILLCMQDTDHWGTMRYGC
jgi:hypothetical protein